ncbi:MAG: hypothetical protein KGM99_01140 [Burkholderiales bacterium]|nr:hypothetical protein [Burkholderiales bacterium]
MSKMNDIKTLTAACLALYASSAGAVEPIRVCVGLQASPPFLFPNKAGTIQVLISQAADQLGMKVKFEPMPLPKCVEELKAGTIQASAAMGFTANNQTIAVFPLKKNGDADPARAVGSARSMIYRAKGNKASWDGTHFSDVKQAVLFPTGNSVFTEKMKALKTPYNDQTATFPRNLSKMLAGQGDLVIGFEHEGKLRLEEPEFSGKIEVLPTPFTEAHYYMTFSKKFYAANEAQVENLWNALPKLKTSPEYLAAIKNIQ